MLSAALLAVQPATMQTSQHQVQLVALTLNRVHKRQTLVERPEDQRMGPPLQNAAATGGYIEVGSRRGSTSIQEMLDGGRADQAPGHSHTIDFGHVGSFRAVSM